MSTIDKEHMNKLYSLILDKRREELNKNIDKDKNSIKKMKVSQNKLNKINNDKKVGGINNLVTRIITRRILFKLVPIHTENKSEKSKKTVITKKTKKTKKNEKNEKTKKLKKSKKSKK